MNEAKIFDKYVVDKWFNRSEFPATKNPRNCRNLKNANELFCLRKDCMYSCHVNQMFNFEWIFFVFNWLKKSNPKFYAQYLFAIDLWWWDKKQKYGFRWLYLYLVDCVFQSRARFSKLIKTLSKKSMSVICANWYYLNATPSFNS